MNVVDTSAWLEFFAGTERARHFEDAILSRDSLLVPVISIYEVFKIVSRQRAETVALQAIAAMQQGQVVPVTTELALEAAQLSLEFSLPMADSLILATARSFAADIWTQDADFEGLPGVHFFPK